MKSYGDEETAEEEEAKGDKVQGKLKKVIK
jgi:hypothetical protein